MDTGHGPAGRSTLAVARARWRAAENRLYPPAMTDTDAYMDAVEAVGRVLALLRTRCAREAELLAAETDEEVLGLVGSGSRGRLSDRTDVVAAACALRSVELGGGSSC
jgi:hypothetical protein